MSKSASFAKRIRRRRLLSLRRWLQAGVVTAGLGLALAAAPGVAQAADDPSPSSSPASSTADSSTTPDHSAEPTSHPSSTDNAAGAADDSDPVEPAPEEPAHADEPANSDATDEPTDSLDAADSSDDITEPVVDDDDPAGLSDTSSPPTDMPTSVLVSNAVAAQHHSITSESPSSDTAISETDTETPESDQTEAGSATTSVHTVETPVATPAANRSTETALLDSATAAASSASCDCAGAGGVTTIVNGFDQFLTSTASWLSTLNQNPITQFFEGVVYLVRRTFFPNSVGVVTAPIYVPLYFTTTSGRDGAQKLGILVSLGNSKTPQLFEFDTGSAGFFAAYSPTAAPWWGSAVNLPNPAQPTQVTFDSGLTYVGQVVNTAVSLYSVTQPCSPVLTTGQLAVGQMGYIYDSKSSTSTVLWDSTGATNDIAPIDGVFYGDFGMDLQNRNDGIVNLIAQLTYGRGISPGFLVHADPDAGQAWLQIGLTTTDLNNQQAVYLPMVPQYTTPGAPTFANTHAGFYSLQIVNATLTITGKDDSDNDTKVETENVGITPDTGATTTLHNPPSTYDVFIKTDSDGKEKLKSNLAFSLTTPADADPAGQKFFDFTTTDTVNYGKVLVQDSGAKDDLFYLNTGISLFFQYDVIYSLGTTPTNGQLGLVRQGRRRRR